MPIFVAYIKADLENVGSAAVDVASATLTIPVTMAVNRPSASSGSPVSGLRPYSGVDVPDVGARAAL